MKRRFTANTAMRDAGDFRWIYLLVSEILEKIRENKTVDSMTIGNSHERIKLLCRLFEGEFQKNRLGGCNRIKFG